MHEHYCVLCNASWNCSDTTGDGSDTDCRWHANVICDQHMQAAAVAGHAAWSQRKGER